MELASGDSLADPIVIVDYDPRWPAIFLRLRDRIAAALGPLAIGVEHVGSTAVPHLAKPIIDLDVVIASRDDLVGARKSIVGAELRVRRAGHQATCNDLVRDR